MNPRSRRRLTVVGPAVAAILGVTAVQSGAAQACGRWLFGDDSPRSVDLTTNSAASTARSGDRAPSTAKNASVRELTVADGAELGTVTGRFVLAGSQSLPGTGRVAFSMRGPSSVTVVDGRAPYKVTIDPRRMKLRDGEYSVSVRVGGADASDAVATLVVKAGYRGPASTSARPSTDKQDKQNKQNKQSKQNEQDKPVAAPTSANPTKKTSKAPAVADPAAKPVETRSTAPQQSAPAAKPQPVESKPAAAPAQAGTEAAEVIRLTNVERTANNCPALKSSATLTRSAQAHSDDMAARNYFSHTSLDGRSPFDRMKAAGYSYRMAAENIAAGQPTPQAVVTAWMNSAGHRANILNCGLTEIGVGIAKGGTYRVYWTQNFGTPM